MFVRCKIYIVLLEKRWCFMYFACRLPKLILGHFGIADKRSLLLQMGDIGCNQILPKRAVLFEKKLLQGLPPPHHE